jgi:hypothetical protein
MQGKLKGKRTYILGGLAIATAIASYLVGDADLAKALNDVWQVLVAGGLITLRAAK